MELQKEKNCCFRQKESGFHQLFLKTTSMFIYSTKNRENASFLIVF
ncbi:hypothetical protein LMIV_0032 [Listeria monocytogenes FSL J1-208]|nr:hypothetical protein LMIV_0032 [Listeria monocytogenes FSL J1-208]